MVILPRQAGRPAIRAPFWHYQARDWAPMRPDGFPGLNTRHLIVMSGKDVDHHNMRNDGTRKYCGSMDGVAAKPDKPIYERLQIVLEKAFLRQRRTTSRGSPRWQRRSGRQLRSRYLSRSVRASATVLQ